MASTGISLAATTSPPATSAAALTGPQARAAAATVAPYSITMLTLTRA
jgi:hypothetical protein